MARTWHTVAAGMIAAVVGATMVRHLVSGLIREREDHEAESATGLDSTYPESLDRPR